VDVSVVVPARDAAATIGETLDALTRQQGELEYEVVVVDNGSRDETAAIARDAGATVVERERGEGPGAARNAGAARAEGEVLAFTDADCVPSPGWLAAGLAAVREGHDLVQGRVEATPGVRVGPFDRTLWVVRAWGLFETANLFVTRALFERLGGFGAGGEDTGADGVEAAPFGEDAVFGWRAVREGARTGFRDGALVHHAVFRRGPREYLAERERDGMFARLVGDAPELRDTLLWKRVFLSRRHAQVWAAIAGVAGAATAAPVLAAAALPYALQVRSDMRRHGARNAGALAAGDLIAAASLARASAEARTLVL
jgi:glycosyltransferase involved in cell wall biosynthesis